MSAGRSTPPDSDTLAWSRTAIDRLIARRDVHLREKTLWRMLYETCARAEELLQVNIEDLDLSARSCPVISKGARPRTRRRGATHAEHVLETVYWDAGTARLLPRLIRGRPRGPLFVGHRGPEPPPRPGYPRTKSYGCTYVAKQVEVKAIYGLWVTEPREVRKLAAGARDQDRH